MKASGKVREGNSIALKVGMFVKRSDCYHASSGRGVAIDGRGRGELTLLVAPVFLCFSSPRRARDDVCLRVFTCIGREIYNVAFICYLAGFRNISCNIFVLHISS